MMNNAAPEAAKRLARLILICFFLSGMTALVYEIIWMRMISRVVGGAPFAVSTILVVFMGGMGLGSIIASRKADKIDTMRLVRTYGLLELTIGLYALAVPVLLLFFKAIYGVIYNALLEHTLAYNLTIFAGAIVLLSLPAVCMGATLPILCRFYVSKLSHLGTHTGRLYGLNTIGAALGSLVCGFWLIDLLGVWGTMLVAVIINCTIGFICLQLSKQPLDPTPQKKAKGKSTRQQKAVPAPAEASPVAAAPTAFIVGTLAIFMVSGFCAMAYEVMWTKLLGLIVGPTTYSFTIVLVTFIVGLALGNLVFGRLADRSANPVLMLVVTQVLAAFFALAISQLLGNSQLFFAKLIYLFRESFAALSMAKAVVLFVFMVLPTFFLGATFPLVAKIYTRSVANVGRRVGVAYTINTIGAVLGSFCAGFVLIPLVGKENGLRMVFALQMTAALAVGFVVLLRQRPSALRWAGLAAALVAGVFACTAYPSWNRHLLATGKYHRFEESMVVDEMIVNTGWLDALLNGPKILMASEKGELIYYGDGIGGFTTVLKYPNPFGEAEYSMANSGKMDASSIGDMKTQTLLAHFPMLFARSPKKVMVLGLASGITGGEALHYPIEQLDVIDINEQVFEAGRFFSPWNNNVLDDPRTRKIVQDGMAHLSLTRTAYDVIISEPSNPWMAGMAALFTEDFFTSARQKLTDDGVYVQWFHCYQMDWDTFALIGRTFARVFPQSMLVSCEPGGLSRDFLFVGFNNPAGLNWDHARKNITFARRSTNIDLAYPELLNRMIVSENLVQLFGPGPINTDSRPRLEYAAPKLMYRGERTQQILIDTLVQRTRVRPETRAASERLRRTVAAQIDFAAYAISVHSPFGDMVDLAAANEDQKQQYIEMLEKYCSQYSLPFSLFHDQVLIDHLREVKIAAIEANLKKGEASAIAHFTLARLYSENGKDDAAIEQYRAAIALDPEDVGSLNDLGFMLSQRGEVDAAMALYKQALKVRPNLLVVLGNLAYLSMGQGRWDDALYYFNETLRVQPDLIEAQEKIGHILFKQGRLKAALAQLERTLNRAPNSVDALNTLAWILATAEDGSLRDPDRAVGYAQKAVAITKENDPVVLLTLAVAYQADGRGQAANQAADKTIALAQQAGRQDIVKLAQEQIK